METPSAPILILASASPRRKEMLQQLGLSFSCLTPDVAEHVLPGEAPSIYVERIASDKARAVLQAIVPGGRELVIAGDTTVTLDGAILGKPRDAQEACDMLLRLSGKTHQVLTGVCLLRRQQGVVDFERLFAVSTDVVFKPLSLPEIEAYVRTGDPMDKAGAYGIQSGASHMIRAIHGSYTNVVGMPMTELYEELQTLGVC